MFPPKGEADGSPANSGPSASADPGYEQMVQHAFAERARRAALADKFLSDAQALRKRAANDRSARLSQSLIDQHEGQASELEQRAAAARPPTAPPLTEAEKAAIRRHQAQAAASSEPGYCQALLKPPAEDEPLAAGVVCSCAREYRRTLLTEMKVLLDASDAFVRDGDFSARAKREDEIFNLPRRQDPAASFIDRTPRQSQAASVLKAALYQRSNALRDEQLSDVEMLCKAVDQRESDPRRRLIPAAIAFGNEVDGSKDRNDKTVVFQRLQLLMTTLMTAEFDGAVMRVAALQDDTEGLLENWNFAESLRPIAANALPGFDGLLKEWQNPTAAVAAQIGADERILGLQSRATTLGAPYVSEAAPTCRARMESELRGIENAADGLKAIRRRFLNARIKNLARFKKDTALWGALAARDGFPSANGGPSFSAIYGDLETVGKTESATRSWLYISIPYDDVARYVGHRVMTSRLQADQFWRLGVDLCGGLWREMAAAVGQAYVKFDVKFTPVKHSACDFGETGPDNTCKHADIVALPWWGELTLNALDAVGRRNEYYASGADTKQRP